MNKRDCERQMFEKDMQEQAEVRQGKMAEHVKEYSLRLAHESMAFMAELFKRMDKCILYLFFYATRTFLFPSSPFLGVCKLA